MATTMTPAPATPNDGSLGAAEQAFAGFFASHPDETEGSPESQPEQQAKKTPAEQVAAATAEPEGESEQAAAPATAPDGETKAEEIRRLKVKLPDGEQELPEEEVVKGYLRTADYTRKTMELARQRKEFEDTELQPVRAEREQYRNSLAQLETALAEITPAEPDWNTLRQTIPAEELAGQMLAWQDRQKGLEKVRAEKARIEAQQAADAQKGFRAHLQEQELKLMEALPDFADPEKAPVLKRDLSAYATSMGFTADDLKQVTDHRLVRLLHDAMQYQRAQAKAPKIEQKIANALVTSTPGASQANAPKASKLAAAMANLKKSGSLDDAARAFGELI